MSHKEQHDEIFNLLKQIAAHLNVPILETELRAITKRLAKYHGPELFRVLMAVPDGDKYMPAGHTLENRVRQALGKAPLKGITAEIIERNKKELIREGQSPDKAEVGAMVARNTLGMKAAEPSLDDLDELLSTDDLLNSLDSI